MLTPAQVAQRANVTSRTIRNYSTEYGEFLSPQARGDDGPRLYSDEDVQVLATIASLRKAGMSRAEIVERLRNDESPPIIDAVATLNETLNDSPEALKAPLNEAFDPLVALPAILARFEAIERRQDTQDLNAIYQAEKRGATLALVAVGFLLLLAWLLVNGR